MKSTWGFHIPPDAMEDPFLTPADKLVYSVLLRCKGKNNYCYPKQRTISRACAVPIRSVNRSIANLCARGYLGKSTQGDVNALMYHFPKIPYTEKRPEIATSRPPKTRATLRQSGVPPYANLA